MMGALLLGVAGFVAMLTQAFSTHPSLVVFWLGLAVALLAVMVFVDRWERE